MPTQSARSKLLKSSQRSNKNAEGKFGKSSQRSNKNAEGKFGLATPCRAAVEKRILERLSTQSASRLAELLPHRWQPSATR